jgi:hypothetical protein
LQNFLKIRKLKRKLKKIKIFGGLGDWGLGIGDWAQSPIPNPNYGFLIIL